MSIFKSINPFDQSVLETFNQITNDELNQKIQNSHTAFLRWRETPVSYRSIRMQQLADGLKRQKLNLAKNMTLSMGKPIKEAIAEVEKCAWVCEYYATHAEKFLENKSIKTDASNSYVRYDPIGPVLAIMPWNYPLWQVFRFLAPTLMVGNVALLKHASNVLRCGEDIKDLLQASGFPAEVFQHLIIDHEQTESVIKHDLVKAVTLTGSEGAGRQVAQIAGQHIKKCVLELGGSNAFIVLSDADLDSVVETAILARFQNNGQSCIAAKRFVVVEDVYDQFVANFKTAISTLSLGDPMNESTRLGPMARKDLADELNQQVKQSINQGATLLCGGEPNGTHFPATLLTDVTTDMPVMQEETFGPVAVVIKVKNQAAAFEVAQNTQFGLGVSIFTESVNSIKDDIRIFKDGAVFINEMVKSDPRLPFGGTGLSGYGRELSKVGMHEFVNKKTVYIK